MDPTSKKCLTRDQIAARLRNPPKKNLDELRWRLARPHLIELVAAMQPINAAAAVRFHSHLCDRLRRGRWVPDQAPDWAQLLSDDAV
ncbi:MAG: hypothetical protein JWM96_1353, partial [Alphaproteobacteria bacterium]|nr:hypothetical protein [Alphaproteobacteria bacterium]